MILGPLDFGMMFTGIYNFIVSNIGLIQSTIGAVQSSYGTITGIFSKLKLLAFFTLFVTLGKCIFAFFDMIWSILNWIFKEFLPWLFKPWPPTAFNTGKKTDKFIEAGLFPWVIRFAIVMSTRIANFPKCFIWYIIDIATWTMYLPFRFLFWILDYFLNMGIVKGEHKVWNFFNDIDYYIHGPVKNYFLDQYVAMNKKNEVEIEFDDFKYKDTNNRDKIIDVQKEIDINNKNSDKSITNDSSSLNLGFHIFHFPNSVMESCYGSSNFKLAKLKSFPMDKCNAFLKTLTNPF